jgi:hypothetical protein
VPDVPDSSDAPDPTDRTAVVPAPPAGPPPDRYGAPRTIPRWAVVALVLLGVLAAVPVVINAVHRASPPSRATITGFTVVNDNQIRVSVDITKRAGDTVTCTVRARDAVSETVGTAEVTLSGSVRSRAVERTFPTSDRAVVAEVTGCVTRPAG